VHKLEATLTPIHAQVHFEQEGSRLKAIQLIRRRSAPAIAALYRTLLALGIVVSSYHVRARATGLEERLVIQRQDGGAVEGALTEVTKAAILPIAFEEGGLDPAGPESG
jgi:hypothetical protein